MNLTVSKLTTIGRLVPMPSKGHYWKEGMYLITAGQLKESTGKKYPWLQLQF